MAKIKVDIFENFDSFIKRKPKYCPLLPERANVKGEIFPLSPNGNQRFLLIWAICWRQKSSCFSVRRKKTNENRKQIKKYFTYFESESIARAKFVLLFGIMTKICPI